MLKSLFEIKKNIKKGRIYDDYIKIIDFACYKKITKKKMLEDIINEYQDYKNIINLCTLKELKLLKKILDGMDLEDLVDSKYDFEREELINKYLITINEEVTEVYIAEEYYESIKKALKNYNEEEVKEKDKKIERVVGFMKIQGVIPIVQLIDYMVKKFNEDPKAFIHYILEDKQVNYYVYYMSDDVYDVLAIYKDLDDYNDLLDMKENYDAEEVGPRDTSILKNIFYYDFDIDNPQIKKFLKKTYDEFYFMDFAFKNAVLETVRYNIEPDQLNDLIKEHYPSKDINKYLKLVNDTMEIMPSSALNGLTQKEYYADDEIIQENAHISIEDYKLFNKLYTSLLEYTNNKYKIRDMKIYNQNYLNPNSLSEISDKLWDNINIIDDFIKENPYKFNKEEIKIINDFKRSIHGLFVITNHDKEYTIFLKDKINYKVKGLKQNISEITPFDELPKCVKTTLIPFKNKIIYDGILILQKLTNYKDGTKMVDKL